MKLKKHSKGYLLTPDTFEQDFCLSVLSENNSDVIVRPENFTAEKRGSTTKLFDADKERAIVNAYEQGKTSAEMVNMFSSAWTTLKSVLVENGVELKSSVWRKNKGRAEKIISLYKQGNTMESIGSELGITRERVRQILRERNIDRKEGGQHVRALKNQAAQEERRRERRDKKAMRYWGVKDDVLDFLKRNNPDDVREFEQQRHNALSRGIEWGLSITNWIELWDESGKKSLRGRGSDKYVLTRQKAKGPFTKENCFITKLHESSRNFINNQFHGIDYDPPEASRH